MCRLRYFFFFLSDKKNVNGFIVENQRFAFWAFSEVLRQPSSVAYLCSKNRTTMNDGNLIPNSERTPSELREQTRKAGIASGAARRRKRDMREWAEVLGQTLMTMKTPDGKEVAEGDMAAAVVLKQYQKAINKSDTAAAAFLMRLRGEDVQKVEQVDDEVKRNAIREQLKQLYGIED